MKVASVWSQKTRIAFFERVVGILKTSLQNVRSSDYIFFILLNSFAHRKTLNYVQGVDDKSTVFTTVVAGQAAVSPSRPGN